MAVLQGFRVPVGSRGALFDIAVLQDGNFGTEKNECSFSEQPLIKCLGTELPDCQPRFRRDLGNVLHKLPDMERWWNGIHTLQGSALKAQREAA